MNTKFLTCIVALLLISCGKEPDVSKLRQIQVSQVGDVTVAVLHESGKFTQGKNTAVIETRRGSTLVDVGEIKVTFSMSMPGMPMVASANVRRAKELGRYIVDFDLSEMSGSWNGMIEFPDGRRTQFTVSAM